LLQHKNKITWLIFTIIGILTIRAPAVFVGPDLDASGLIALVWFRVNDLQIGQDIVTHVGPLGYLLMPIYIEQSLWLQALLESIFVHFLFIFSFALFVTKLHINWKDNLLVFLLLVTLSYLINISAKIDEQVIFSITILLYLVYTGKISNKYSIPLLSFLALSLAIESFIKFNLTIASMSVVTIFSLISVAKKEFKKPLVFCVMYVSCLAILWVISEQNISNFPSYFIDGFMVSSGYSYAMAIDGPIIQVISAIIAIVFTMFLFIYSLIRKHHNITIFILLNSVLLFLAFKHGFIRHDAHVLYFYFTYGVFFLSMYIIYKYDLPKAELGNKKLILLTIILLGAILCVVSIDVISSKLIVPNATRDNAAWSEVIPLILDESYQSQRLEKHIDFLKSNFELDEKMVNRIGNKTMEIFPYDVMIPWVYDFNWSPRPMPWSFQVFNTQIDKLNAQHFLNKNESPQEILYSYKSIDNRYPLYDEPATFQALLENYQYVNTSNNFVLLEYNPRQDIKEKEDLGTLKTEIGNSIKIPKYDKGYVFANIDLKFSTLGKFLHTVYKPSQAHIIFKFSDSTYSKEFRFIPGASIDGVFVSQYVDSIHDIKSIFSGKIVPNIDEIVIWVDDPTHYEKNIDVKFVGIPTKITVQKDNENKIPDWTSLKLIHGGSRSVDFVDNKLFSQEDEIISINDSTRRLIGINGWAVDELSQDGTVKTFLVLRGEGKERILPTHKVFRPDVSKFFGIDSYQYSGWSTALDRKEFENGCYALSLRIPRENGQEYFEINEDKSICFGK
jgi:hypothetical protein